MAKSKKAQKKVDFNKVRFKIGKKLPKNLNETRTDFKAKSLVIKQQFTLDRAKHASAQPVSHRNLTLKELYTNLNHHNVNTRLDAAASIRDMIQENKHVVVNELSSLLEHICVLFSDREHKIRRVAMQVIGFVINLDLIQDKTLFRPYFTLLNAHLTCAMTHIDENIQNSSLQLLDLFIQNLPSLIQTHYSSLFENFIEQISKLSTIKSSGKTKRVLKNDPYKLTSTQTWRSNVLARIFKLISLLINENHEQKLEKPRYIEFDQVEIEIFNNSHQKDSFKLENIMNKSNAKLYSNDVHLFLSEFIHVLGPLLIDCWIEAKPEDSNIIETTQSLDIMFSVLSILNLIVSNLNVNFAKLIEDFKMNKKSDRSVEPLFLSKFPYILAETSNNAFESSSISIKTINLLLCKLTSSSFMQLNNDTLLSMLEYCLEVFESQTSASELSILLTIFETIFKNYSSFELIRPYVICLLNYFDTTQMQSSSKFILFQFLSEKFYKKNILSVHSQLMDNFFEQSLKYLEWNLKEKKYTEKMDVVIDHIRKILSMNQASIQELFQNEYVNLLNLCADEDLGESTKKRFIELLAYLPTITNFMLQKLSILIINQKFSFKITTQILTTLCIHALNERLSNADYLTFILTLYNGYTCFDLTTKVPQNLKYYFDKVKFDSQVKLIHHLNQFLISHPSADKMHDILLCSSIPIFDELTTWPLSTIYGLLNLIKIDSFGNSQAFTTRIYNIIKLFVEWLNESISMETIVEWELMIKLIESIDIVKQFDDIQTQIKKLKSRIY